MMTPELSRVSSRYVRIPRIPSLAPSGRAVTSTTSASAFEQKNFSPLSRPLRATVWFAPTSEPPARSVRNMPPVQSVSRSVDTSRGTTCSICSGVP